MRRIPRKLTFMAKYGSPADRQKVTQHVDELLDKADKGAPEIYGDLATSSEVPLNSQHVHRIIDSHKFEGIQHPVGQLVRWHFGDIKHEHWDKIARATHLGGNLGGDASAVLAHMPPEHLPTVVANDKVDPFIRQLAKNRYATHKAQNPDPDELLKDLQS
jgi:hypothetical protein